MTALKLFVPFLLICFFNQPMAIRHPLHVSTVEADFNPKEKTIEITCKIFTDDFETALSKTTADKIDLSKPDAKAAMDKFVSAYLTKNLRFKVGGKQKALKYIGFEKDREATNAYFEIENVSALNNAEIYDTILYDLFTDQMSIVHVVKGGKRISNKVIYPDKVVSVKF